jgi:hypothetical protein
VGVEKWIQYKNMKYNNYAFLHYNDEHNLKGAEHMTAETRLELLQQNELNKMLTLKRNPIQFKLDMKFIITDVK